MDYHLFQAWAPITQMALSGSSLPLQEIDQAKGQGYNEAVGGDANTGGYGLGLRSRGNNQPDQVDPAVAAGAMRIRIELVLEKCVNCSPTDKFIAAALAENGPGFTSDNMRTLRKGGQPPSGTLYWKGYLSGPSQYNDSYNKLLIRKFATDVI